MNENRKAGEGRHEISSSEALHVMLRKRDLSYTTERGATKDEYHGICILKESHWSQVITN